MKKKETLLPATLDTKKNLGGRPKKYSSQYVRTEIANMLKFLNDNPEVCWVRRLFEGKPYTRQTYYWWCRSYGSPNSPNYDKEVADNIVKINETIEDRLIDMALSKKIDVNFAKYLLAVKFGMEEVKKVEETKITVISLEKQKLLEKLLGNVKQEDDKQDFIEAKVVETVTVN